STLYSLIQDCDQRDNCNIAISNPCFELWLGLHYQQHASIPVSGECKHLKSWLGHTVHGGYKMTEGPTFISIAAKRARAADDIKGQGKQTFPAPMITKLYILAEAMLEKLSFRDFPVK
ncbi:MAG: RloB domain-containing protein, partial [Bacteroidota bacterium]